MPWKPANGRHAIERASVSFRFREGLTAHAHEKILGTLNSVALSANLNETMILPPPLQVNFVQAGSGPAPVPQQIIGPPQGRSMRRRAGNKVAEELVLTGDALVYTTYEYERWKGFRQRAEAVLPAAVSQVSTTTAISEVRVEYWDRFDRHPDDGVDAPLTNIDSILVGEALRAEPGAWHCHVGFFTDLQAKHRTLINANVDAVASTPTLPQKFSGGVTGQARIYTLASVQAVGEGNPLGDWNLAQKEIDRAHYLLKSVLSDIIHPDIAKAIHLNADVFKLR